MIKKKKKKIRGRLNECDKNVATQMIKGNQRKIKKINDKRKLEKMNDKRKLEEDNKNRGGFNEVIKMDNSDDNKKLEIIKNQMIKNKGR